MDTVLASRLRTTIQRCLIFVFVASSNSARSGWMPWELGLAHGSVGRVHLYMLEPTAMKALAAREYLKLYEKTIFGPEGARKYLESALAAARKELNTPAALDAARLMGKAMAAGAMAQQLSAAAEQGNTTEAGFVESGGQYWDLWNPFSVWDFWTGKRR